VDGEFRFRSEPPLLVPVRDLVGGEEVADRLQSLLELYSRSLSPQLRRLLESYRIVDMARKVVGVGSVGTRAWAILLIGRDRDDPLVLQAKEAEASVLERFVGSSEYSHHGQRVVEGQRLMQAASDIMLGWIASAGLDNVRRDFYVRQLWDGKGSADLDTIRPQGMGLYGEMCAWTLARAHARSGDRFAIASYLGTGDSFPQAIARFAATYADQNERDHEALAAAARSNRIQVTEGV
jgi:Uncharacterized protein conserved in bacteria (DUF2252)